MEQQTGQGTGHRKYRTPGKDLSEKGSQPPGVRVAVAVVALSAIDIPGGVAGGAILGEEAG